MLQKDLGKKTQKHNGNQSFRQKKKGSVALEKIQTNKKGYATFCKKLQIYKNQPIIEKTAET
jgi:hypothetical protein